MQSVKAPVFSGLEADFDVWKMRFKAFCTKQGYGMALDDDEKASAEMQLELYTSLVLALPEDDLAHIEETDEKDITCGTLAWQALMSHWESSGLYRRADLQKSLQEVQHDTETAAQFFNRLLRLRNKLARVGETVSDDTILMHLVAGLRDEYASITDTWDESTMTLDKAKTDLKVKAVRVEQRMAREHSGKAAGFQATTTPPMSVEQLQRRVAELESVIANSKTQFSVGNGSRGNTRQPGGRIFKGVCYGCGERGHRRSECSKRPSPHQSANQAAASRELEEDISPIAFPAIVSDRSWADVVRQDMPPTDRVAATNAMFGSSAAFMAETLGPDDHHLRSEAQGKFARWCTDSGASDHMTSCKADFYNLRHAPTMWVKGICAYSEGVGDVKVNMRDSSGHVVASMLKDVQYVPDLGRRAGCDEHRLFSVFKARDAGHRIVFEDPCDYIQVYDASGRSLQVPLRRYGGLIWLDTELCLPSVTAMHANASISRHLLHLRLGHLGSSAMDKLHRSGLVDLQCQSGNTPPFCETCAVCKSVVLDIPRTSDTPDPDVCFHTLGVDLNGPMSVPSLGGGRYSIAAVDFKTRYILHDVLRHKSETPRLFKRFLIQIRDMGYKVHRVRVDNDSVLLSVEFTSLLDEFGIALQRTAPYAHWQHGRIERQWGTLVPMALAMIHGAGLDRCFWALAMHAATYIRNRVWSNGADGVPYQLVTGLPPDLDYLRVFGCPCYVHIDKQLRRKLDDRAWKGVFVGYALDSPAYLIWNPRTRRLVRSRNVVFDELISAGSTVMGERMPLLHDCCDDSDDDGGATVQLIGDSLSGEQVATPQSIGQVEVNQPGVNAKSISL